MSKDTLKDGRQPGFYIIDNEIIEDYGAAIGVYGVAVYNVLVSYANQHGQNAFPSYQTIAEKIDISRPKAIETIKLLVDVGLITKTERYDNAGDKTSNAYTIVNVKGGKPHLPPSKQKQPRVVNKDNQGGKRGLPDQDPMNNTQSEQERQVDKQPAKPEQPTATKASLSLSANEYLPGIPDPRKQATANVVAETVIEVKKLGVNESQFREVVDALLDGFGKKPLVDAGDDRVLNYTQGVALTVMRMSDKFRTPSGIKTIFDSWLANDYRGDSMPTSEQFKEHASLMAANKVVCTRKDKKTTTGSNGKADYVSPLRRMKIYDGSEVAA